MNVCLLEYSLLRSQDLVNPGEEINIPWPLLLRPSFRAGKKKKGDPSRKEMKILQGKYWMW
jgi:hypothetical protein